MNVKTEVSVATMENIAVIHEIFLLARKKSFIVLLLLD